MNEQSLDTRRHAELSGTKKHIKKDPVKTIRFFTYGNYPVLRKEAHKKGSVKIMFVSILPPSLNYLQSPHYNNGSNHQNGQLENFPRGCVEAPHQVLLTV